MNSCENKHIGRISIIMPFYKAEKYVARMINDIQSQTYIDWELIAISNGPEQEAQNKIVNDFAEKDSRIKLVCTDTAGVSNARNLGLSLVTGDWVTFVDADDRLDENHLNLFVNAVQDGTEIVCGGFMYSNGKENIKKELISEEYCKDSSLKSYVKLGCLIQGTPWTKMYKRQFLLSSNIKFPVDISFSEDRIWNYKVFMNAQNIVYIPLTGYKYVYISGASASSRYHQNFEETMVIVRNLCKEMYIKTGYSIEETETAINKLVYLDSYFSIRNLFGERCDLSFIDKVKRVAGNLYKNKEISMLIDRYIRNNKSNGVLFVFNLLYSTKSPYFIVIFYGIIFKLKRFWDNI